MPHRSGAVAFSGPASVASSSTKHTTPSRSSMWIQENHCRPVPSTVPANSRTGRASAGSAPPSPPSTTPIRSVATFTP
jgi:hypothetical protein